MPGPPAAARLASLDAMRGFAIAGMMLVNNPGDWGHLYAPLDHAKWNGWTFTDTVFPFFLFVSGVAMVLSLHTRRERENNGARLLAVSARRAAVIFALGLALNFIPAFDAATVRIPGVLQRIALCTLIAAPIVIWGGWRAALVAIVTLFALYAIPMLFIPVPGPDAVVAAGLLEPGRDFGAWVDRTTMGAHLWAASRTWDPEGIVSTLPAAATLLFGVVTGHAIVRGSAGSPRMAIAGVALLVLGLAMDAAFMPINKNLWTPTYAVFMSGWALLALGLFRALLDESVQPLRARASALCRPLTIFGMNALFLFVLSGLIGRLLVTFTVAPDTTLKAWLYAPIRSLPIAAENASLVYAVAFELAMFAVAWILWRKRWFVRA